MSSTLYKRNPSLDEAVKEVEVLFHPGLGYWYYMDSESPEDIPTPQGPASLDSLTQKQEVKLFLGIDAESFGPKDILFMRDFNGLIGLFTLVAWANHGELYRTGEEGFAFKSVRFFYDSHSRPNSGACHFFVTENAKGEWGLFAIANTQEPLYRLSDYREFFERRSVVQGCHSEAEVISALKEKYHIDLLAEEIYLRFDLNAYLP